MRTLLLKIGVGLGLDEVEILVSIEGTVSGFYHCNGNVGAMVGNSLTVCKKVGKNEAKLDGTATLLKTGNVSCSYLGN